MFSYIYVGSSIYGRKINKNRNILKKFVVYDK